ncbi:MAG: hypothetical protein AAFW84_09055 [Cyanobacteria bacterium J06635_15]
MPSSKNKQQAPDTLIKIGRQGAVYQQKVYRTAERAYGSTHEESEEYEEVIVDRSAAEILDQINQRVKSPYYSLYFGIGSLVLVFLCFQVSDILGSLLFLVLMAATFLLYRADLKRKTTPLFYQFSDDYSERKFSNGITSFSSLATTRSSWRLKSKIAVSDWKRNAGSNSALIRQRSRIGQQNPTLLKTNVEVWGVNAGSIKLYLLPDRFFVFQDGVYSAVPYSEVEASFQDLEYVEQEALPSDATIIGKTWKYIRRDGGPDRRFKNNRQLPIVRYGVVAFSSSNFTAYLIVSSLNIASSFTRSFSKLLTSSNATINSSPSSGNQSLTFPEEDLVPEHLEPLMRAASKDLELTTSQIAKLIGVSNSVITKNPASFDYEGFRFTRSGRSGRQISWRVEYLGSK